MANERNAGRKPKYIGETVTMPARRVPKDALQKCIEAVEAVIKPFTVGYVPEEKEAVTDASSDCGCYLEKGIMKRGKEKPACKLKKEQHNF